MNQNYDDIVDDGIDIQDERSNAKVEALEINKGTNQVATLNGFHLYDNGHRVYTGDFKPRLTDLGNIADLGGFKANGVTAQYFDHEGSVPWNVNSGVYNNKIAGASNMVIQFYGPGGSNPATQFKVGYRNGGIWYRSARDGVGFEEDWTQIYTSKHKPTAQDVGALPVTGGTLSGTLRVNTIHNAAGAELIRYNPDHNAHAVGNTTSKMYIDALDGRVTIRNGVSDYQMYHTGNKPTANDVGALAGVSGRPLRIPTGGDQWQMLARVRIPQGGATARFTVIGGAGFNAATSGGDGNNKQSTLHEIIIRSGNNAPKGLNCMLHHPSRMLTAVSNVAWKGVGGDEYEIWVQTGNVHIHGVFVTGQFSDNAAFISWGTGAPAAKPASLIDGGKWQWITDAGGTMAGTLRSGRKVGQFAGVACGATRLNDLYSTEAGMWSYVSNASSTVEDLFPVNNNANAVLTFNTHHGDYGHQMGLSSNGKLYHRWWKDTTWKEIVRAETDGTLNVRSLGVTNGAAVGSLHVSGAATVNGTITSPEAADYMRCTHGGQYGLVHRHDGISYYMLLTNKGDPNGNWNSLRPFRLDLATGRVYMNNGVSANSISVDGVIYGAGSVVTDNTPNATHSLTMMSNETNTAGKNYLRKFRNYNAGTIWHETVDANAYRIATGSSDSNELLSLSSGSTCALRINGTVYSSRASNSVAAVVAARNSATSAGVAESRLEVHGNGDINITTHDGSNWYYPIRMYRDNNNIRFDGVVNAQKGIESWSALKFKSVDGATGDVWTKVWGNATQGRPRVLETMDDQGWMYYCQRTSTQGVQFAVNGRISSGSTYVGTGGNPFMIDDSAIVSNGAGNALVKGMVAGGSWSDWKTRASGLHVYTLNVNNEATNIWKAEQPAKSNNTAGVLAAMQVHRPSNDPARTIVRIQSGDIGQFDFHGNGDLSVSRNGSFNDVYIRSDARLKTDVQQITGAVDKVMLLKGCTYDKHERVSDVEKTVSDGGIVSREAGIIAQDLEAVLPEAVKMTVDSNGTPIRTVSPAATIGLLVEAIKEQQKAINEMRTEIAALKAK